MRSPFYLRSILGILLVTLPATAREEADKSSADDQADEDTLAPSFGAEVDFASRYLWRGAAASQGAVLQPWAWLEFYGFTASAWGNVMLHDPVPHRFSLVQPQLLYTLHWGPFELQPGIVGYFASYPNALPTTTAEVAVAAAYKYDDITLQLNNWIDIWHHTGSYFGQLGPVFEREFWPLTLRIGIFLGWATADFNKVAFFTDSGGLQDIEGNVSLRWDILDWLYITPHAAFSALINPSINVSNGVLWNAGMGVGVEF